MIPQAARLGSRPARSTGESDFGQRADTDFKEIMDERGVIVDVKYHKVACRACGAIGYIYNGENDYKICAACNVIQNDGIPEGRKMSKKEQKRQIEQFKANMTMNNETFK